MQFDSKPVDAYESDSDDVDESLTVPQPPVDDEDDPVVEYEDEFGRVRTGRRSEIPRHLLKEEKEEDIEYVSSISTMQLMLIFPPVIKSIRHL